MKKKGHRTIPDFSRAKPQNPNPQQPAQKSVAPPPRPFVPVKPQSTSTKSGRRGQ